jgi:putative transposase
LNTSTRRTLVETDNSELSITRQCALLGISRSSYYYQPTVVDPSDLVIMRAIDELHLDYPFYGYRRMTVNLQDCLEGAYLPINSKKVRRLMQIMGISAIYPKENLSKRNLAHKIYPYLLRNVPITHTRKVYSTDITYVPMAKGFMYLTAVIDWYSRYILSWRLSNTLTTDFCIEAVQEAFDKFGKPEIFNTDQGSQYTSNDFIELLKTSEVRISMDGKGRALDNIFIERFWRSIKREHIYLYAHENGSELYKGLSQYFDYYNNRRKHQALNYKTPNQVFNVS